MVAIEFGVGVEVGVLDLAVRLLSSFDWGAYG